MFGRRSAGIAISTLFGILSCTALSQQLGNGSAEKVDVLRTPEAEFFGQSDPATEWAVWAAFYRQLQYQASQSSAFPLSQLKTRVGLSEESAVRVVTLGDEYLQTLRRLQEERRRLGGLANVRVPQGDLSLHLAPPVERREPSEADLAMLAQRRPLRLPRPEGEVGEGPKQREDPVVAFDGDARTALEVHKQQLIGLIGAREYAALDRWIASEFGERVRVPRRAPSPSSQNDVR